MCGSRHWTDGAAPSFGGSGAKGGFGEPRSESADPFVWGAARLRVDQEKTVWDVVQGDGRGDLMNGGSFQVEKGRFQ